VSANVRKDDGAVEGFFYLKMNPKTNIIETFKTPNGEWAKCKTVNGVQYRSLSYEAWRQMLRRVADGESGVNLNYSGCTIHPDFMDYQVFASWHVKQIGFNKPKYVLDKDILSPNVKIYSPDTCVLVPNALNLFFSVKKHSQLPPGIYLTKNQTFKVKLKSSCEQIHIGTYKSLDLAIDAYASAKRREELKLLGRCEAGEFIVDPRVLSVLRAGRNYFHGQ
jgi:hypothetical protein